MGARDRGEKKGPRMITETNKGGRSRTADMTPDLSPDQHWEQLPALIAHAQKSCFDMNVSFEHFLEEAGMRKVEIDDFFEKLGEQVLGGNAVPAERFFKYFDAKVIEPLRELYDRLQGLLEQSVTQDESDRRLLWRQAEASDPSKFESMLLAFEHLVDTLMGLNAEDVKTRHAFATKLQETNHVVIRGEAIKFRLVGSVIVPGQSHPSLEQQMTILLNKTRRELEDKASALHTTQGLEVRWTEVGLLLESYQTDIKRFATHQDLHADSERALYREQDAIKMYQGEWTRQISRIKLAEEFFRAAGVDPFELSNRLSKLNRDELFTMPDGEERFRLIGEVPQAFPTLEPSRVEERAAQIMQLVEEALDVFNKPKPAPLPKTSAELPKIERVGGPCPLTLVELALGTYATIVARFRSGKPYPTSGRTTRKVHESILTPAGLTYGCTDDQFKEACQEGEKCGWLQTFKRYAKGRKVWYICFQPTFDGFALAETLFAKLPADFRERIEKQNEALRAASEEMRKAFREKRGKKE